MTEHYAVKEHYHVLSATGRKVFSIECNCGYLTPLSSTPNASLDWFTRHLRTVAPANHEKAGEPDEHQQILSKLDDIISLLKSIDKEISVLPQSKRGFW